VQYNVEWLFVDYYAPMDCPGAHCTWANQSEAITHMKYVADVLETLQPDILNLCEVEGCDELNMLISKDYLGDSSYIPYLHLFSFKTPIFTSYEMKTPINNSS
jgi:hypothetical protein